MATCEHQSDPEHELPTFAFGSYGQDSAPRCKVVDFRIPIEVGQVRVRPADIIFGDIDGVLLVPVEVEEEVFTRALEKARGEKLVKRPSKREVARSKRLRSTESCKDNEYIDCNCRSCLPRTADTKLSPPT